MGKTKILIVEDELIAAEAINNSLESIDYCQLTIYGSRLAPLLFFKGLLRIESIP